MHSSICLIYITSITVRRTGRRSGTLWASAESAWEFESIEYKWKVYTWIFTMAYPQGYLYQPSASLALYSCPAYNTSVISGPRTEELGRSSSGSAFAPYAGSTAFTSASPGYNSHLQYSADAAAAAATFTSYVVSAFCFFLYSFIWKVDQIMPVAAKYIMRSEYDAHIKHQLGYCSATFAVLTIKFALPEFVGFNNS